MCSHEAVKQVILREWTMADAERLAEIANNKKIFDNLRDGFPHPYSIEDAKAFITTQIEEYADKNSRARVFAIEVDGVVAGSIGAFIQTDIYRKNAEIGYYLSEEFCGKGIMTEAIMLLTEYMFMNYDIIRIYAEPFARNTGSRRCLEKAGFRLEAELRSNVIKNGVIENSCIYALLREER